MSLNKLIKEAISELHNVTWPTKNHAIKISKITIWFTLSVALVLWLFDFMLSETYTFIAKLNPRNNVPIQRELPPELDGSWNVTLSWVTISTWNDLLKNVKVEIEDNK